MKLTNKDKNIIRQALYRQIENIQLAMADQDSGIYIDLKHLTEKEVSEYCYKIVGLYPSQSSFI